MNINIREYITEPRNAVQERELAKKLRDLPEEERFQIIQEVLHINDRIALELAFTTLQKPKYFIHLLDQGLANANAHGIKYWLEYTIPKIGFHRSLVYLTRKRQEHADGVKKAMYFLPKFVPLDNEQAKVDLQRLREAIEQTTAQISTDALE